MHVHLSCETAACLPLGLMLHASFEYSLSIAISGFELLLCCCCNGCLLISIEPSVECKVTERPCGHRFALGFPVVH